MNLAIRTRGYRIAVGVTLLALSASAGGAQAAATASNGPIVFMRYATGHEDDHTAQLFVRAPSGAERQITHVTGGCV